MEVKKGDILRNTLAGIAIDNSRPDEDEERYFLRHPGGGAREFAEWIVEMDLAWTGMDCGSGDHPMNTSIRTKRPDATREYEKRMGKKVDEIWPEEDLFVRTAFPSEKESPMSRTQGDIEQVLPTGAV